MQNRIQWIDYLKGMAILFVIIGHTIGNFYIRSIIFSVHMPLFFFLSGINCHHSEDRRSFQANAWKSFKRLIIPAYVIWMIRFPIIMIRDSASYTSSQVLNCALYASGSRFSIGFQNVPAFGMMWFLVVLFTIRLMVDMILYLKNTWAKVIIVIALCILGVAIGGGSYLPFSFDVTLVSILFFYMGYVFVRSKHNINTTIIGCLSGFSWLAILMFFLYKHEHFELATREYPYGMLSVAMALFGCLFFCIIVSKKKNYNKLERCVLHIGKESMTLFCIHAFDAIWWPFISKMCNDNTFIAVVPRILMDLLLFYIVDAIRRKYNLKREKKK